MTLVLHDERAPGPDDCAVCGAPVMRAIDELFRLVVLDQLPAARGPWLYGAEYFKGVGGAPDQPLRARLATQADPPWPRWYQHVCELA